MLVAMRGHFQSWGSRARGALEEGTGAESLQERRLFHQVPLPWSPATSSLLGHWHQAEQGFLGTQGSGEATSRVPHAHFPGIHSGVTLSSSSPACHMLTQTVGPEQPPPQFIPLGSPSGLGNTCSPMFSRAPEALCSPQTLVLTLYLPSSDMEAERPQEEKRIHTEPSHSVQVAPRQLHPETLPSPSPAERPTPCPVPGTARATTAPLSTLA